MRRDGVRWPLLGACFAVVGALSWAGLRLLLRGGGSVPEVSWLGAGVILFLALLLTAAGWDIRRYLQGKHPRRPSANRARYTLVGTQAGAVTGALLAGWYLASALVAFQLPDVPALRELAVRYAVHAAVAAVLAGAGMFAQWCCRLPPQDPEEELGRRGPGPEPLAG